MIPAKTRQNDSVSIHPRSSGERVLLVSVATLYGGAETYYVKLAEILRRQYHVAAIVFDPTLAHEFQRLGVQTQYFDGAQSRYATAIYALITTLRDFCPDLIHLNGQAEAYLALPLALDQIPVIITRHTPLADVYLGAGSQIPVPLKRFLVVQSHRRAEHIVCVSRYLHSQLALYIPSKKLSTIHTWLAADKTDPARLWDSPPTPLKVLFAGRVVRSKGIFDLVEALRGVSGVRLDIVGNGPDLDEAKLISNGLPVTFHGFQRDCIPFYFGADLLVFPSHEGFEGLPQVPLEAMCAGLPCLSSDINAVKELVADEFPSALFRTANVEDLKEKLEFFRDNPQSLNELSQAGIERVRASFLESSVSSKYLKLFHDVMNASR